MIQLGLNFDNSNGQNRPSYIRYWSKCTFYHRLIKEYYVHFDFRNSSFIF